MTTGLSRSEAARTITAETGHKVSDSTLRNGWEGRVVFLAAPPRYDPAALAQALEVARMRRAGIPLQTIQRVARHVAIAEHADLIRHAAEGAR